LKELKTVRRNVGDKKRRDKNEMKEREKRKNKIRRHI
jgi:hypothetical protein